MADTRGVQQDEIHKKSITDQIRKHIDSVTAVLVLANGTVPRITVGTDYALSTLSALFPKSLASNTAFMFTNVSSPLHWNFSLDALPDVLKDAPEFVLNNPIALQKEYSKLKGGANMSNERENLRKPVQVAEQNALEMFVDLFDWLDSLEPQSVTGIVSIYDHCQSIEAKITNVLAQMDQVAKFEAKFEQQKIKLQKASAVSVIYYFHLSFASYAHWTKDMEACFNKPPNKPVWQKQRTSKSNYLCITPECHSNCRSIRLFTLISRLLRLPCGTCNHSHRSHSRTRHTWAQVADTRASVDEDCAAAKAEKEATESTLATYENTLKDLNDAMDRTLDELARLAEGYAALSLSGPFSAHVEKATRLLEHRYKDMERKKASREQLDKLQDSLDLMKRKLEVVKKAEEKALKEM